MPTRLWDRRSDSGASGSGSSHGLRLGLLLVLAPPLLALLALTMFALLSNERAATSARNARDAIRSSAPAPAPEAAADLERALDQMRRAQLAVAAGILGALALTAVAARNLHRRLIRPIRTAQAAARRVGGGETGVRLDPSADGELGDLAAAMNAMAAELDRSRPTLLATSVLEHSPDLVLVVGLGDSDGDPSVEPDDQTRWVVRYASPAATTLLGRPSEWLAGVPVASFVHPDDRAKLLTILATPGAAGGRGQGASEIRLSHVQGRWVEVEVVAADLRADPSVAGVVLHLRDMFERRAEEEELRHLALHDPLTRLANRTLFGDHVEHALARNRRTATRPHAVLIVDLDGFKTINDSLGHAAGDEVLVELAERLRTRVRPGDTAARLGGDEFGVLLENSSEEDASVVASRILDAISGPIEVHGKDVVITGSVGIALSEDGQNAEALMRNADVAMYSAKSAGKGRFQIFRREMQEAVARRLDLEADLRRALDREDLVLHYQPIVELATGTLAGLEVLVRWRRSERELVYPGDFIGVAEESGLIRPMGRWILAEACRQQQAWARRFPRPAPVGVSVNVSPLQVDDPEFVADVVTCLSETGIPAAELTLEITETVFMRDFESAVAKLQRLKDLGVKVAIDDFGTGWSSFSRLRSMPIDVLKIDKAFVDGVTRGPEHSAVAQAVVKLAHTFALRTVAEGIEYPSQAERLADMKCDMGQGYLYARPLPAEAVEVHLRRQRPLLPVPGSEAG
jgi:diguanylate cyclase (GGDEF)-like protein/PAS domain S-box-containing protein